MEHWRRYRHPKIYQEERKPKRTRLSWRPPRLPVIGFGVVLVVGGLSWFIFRSPFFAIKTVEVRGESTADLTTATMRFEGRNILLLSDRMIFRQLQAVDPSLATARVTRGFPDQVILSIERRHPALVWKAGDTSWAIDPNGVAFVVDPSTTTGIPVIVDQRNQPVVTGHQLLSPEFVQFTTDAFHRVPDTLAGKIDHAEIGETTFHLRVVTEWGWTVILDTTRPLDGQLTNLALVLKDHRADIHEYVDLRVVGWGYLK